MAFLAACERQIAAMAEAEASPALDAQRKAHPELSEAIDELQKYVSAKLYHQLTQALLKYLASPCFALPSAAASLLQFFDDFIKDFDKKFDKAQMVKILGIVCKPQTAEKALEIIEPFEASVGADRDAKYLWQALKAEKLTDAGKLDAAKELLETLGTDIGNQHEVDAAAQSQFHKTSAMLAKVRGRPDQFYKSSILYLAYTPLSAIPEKDRAQVAFEIAVSCLVAEEEFNFGELLQQEIMPSLDGSNHAWIKELLTAFGEGKFEMYDAAMAKHKAQIDATPQLKAAAATVLRHKMCALALMELAFRKPKKQRRLTFAEVAEHCRVGPKEVEFLVMKAMCANLIKGQIDEVAQLVLVTWVQPRILDTARIDLMRERMDAWADQTGLLLKHLEDMTPELLVS